MKPRKPIYTTADARRVLIQALKRKGMNIPPITDAVFVKAVGDLTAYSIAARDVDTLISSFYNLDGKPAVHPAITALTQLSAVLSQSLASLGLTLSSLEGPTSLGTHIETR